MKLISMMQLREKEVKYEELMTGARTSGCDAELITLDVGSRGVINPAGFKHLRQTLNICTTKRCPNFYCALASEQSKDRTVSGAVGTE